MKEAFVDLGANVGEVSERFAVRYPGFDIFCFEPDAKLLYAIMRRSTRIARPF